MELCLYQGTFNPIHNAHLRAAEYVLEHCNVDKILFIPAFIPPHKSCNDFEAVQRLNMVKLATDSNSRFEVSDIEFRLGGKSYTYRTICELYKKYAPNNKIKFIIGTDAFKLIESWYETDKLKELVHFLVFLRENDFSDKELYKLKEKGYEFEIMPLTFEDISSTEIREMAAKGLDLSKFVPQKVEEYIRQNELYKN